MRLLGDNDTAVRKGAGLVGEDEGMLRTGQLEMAHRGRW